MNSRFMETPHNSTTKQTSIIKRLRCSVQNYDWGRPGHNSRVARMFSLNSGSDIEPDKPYAEFWMGTHESGSSYVVESVGGSADNENGVHSVGGVPDSSTSLKSWISQNPKVLGDKVVAKWDLHLPFLFKVLSVGQALSIQAHPDEELARILHRSHPNLYKDENHKPEMALAITEFEALCGFISIEELKCVLRNVPEVVELVGSADVKQILHMDEQEAITNAKPLLKSIFTQLMMASKEAIFRAVSKMKIRLHTECQERRLTDKEQLVLILEKQYGGDVGVLSSFFFNYIKLKPGEALYLGPNEPHAYLGGECIECMATSDNVVRAGLTPKRKDVQTLCSMLTYKQGYPEILKGVPINAYTKKYLPPFDEFEVDCCNLPGAASVVFPSVPGPSIFIVTGGHGRMHSERESISEDLISEGDVLFAPADTRITISTTAASDLLFYRAGVNSRFFSG